VYRTGHYGAALLAAAPLAAGLAVVASAEVAIGAAIAVLVLTPLPDYDQRVPLIEHRGPTHTVGFALVVGAGSAAVGWVLGSGVAPFGPVAGAVLGGTVGTLAILAHLAADVVTPAGIEPFWPVSDRHYSLGWVRAANPLANYGLLALGAVVAVGALSVVIRLAGG